MALAQRHDIGSANKPSLLLGAKEAARAPGIERDNVSMLRRVQGEQRSDTGATGLDGSATPSGAPESRRSGESRNHSTAISLIDQVSGLIPILVDENEALRALMKRDRENLEADVERATLVACEWRKSAESAKQQIEVLERKLAELNKRLEHSEAQVLSEKELASKSARDAAEAECLSSLFEEKLLSSFGAGSLFQQTLDRIRQRAETDGL